MTQTAHNNGFTLIELLIATVIFTIVIGSVYGACRVTFGNINYTEMTLSHSISGQNAIACIARDLEYLSVKPESPFIAKKDRGTIGDTFTITFTTSNRLITNPNELKGSDYVVSYTIEPDDNTDLLKMYRSSRLAHLDEEKADSIKYLLIDQLEKITFVFYDENGNEFSEWEKETGDEERKEDNTLLPVKIRIELSFPTDDTRKESSIIAMNVALPKSNENEDL